MAGHPLRSATDRRLGRPLPHQLPNQTRVHLIPPEFLPLYHAVPWSYAVLAVISNCYPPVWGRLPTRYSPVRHSVTKTFIRRIRLKCFVRLACVKHAASVHPEPGSNSHVKSFNPASRSGFSNQKQVPIYCFKVCFLKSCSFIFRWLEFILDELCSSWIFQGYSLFSYQCSLLFLATLICYHIFKCLSTTFLFFFFSSFELMCCRFATAWLFYQIASRLSTTISFCLAECFHHSCVTAYIY